MAESLVPEDDNPLKSVLQRLPLCGDREVRMAISLLWAFVAVYIGYNLYRWSGALLQWDLLLISGALAFILGLVYVRRVGDWFDITVRRLLDRRVIDLDEAGIRELVTRMNQDATLWARGVALIGAVALCVAFVMSLLEDYRLEKALLLIPEVIGAYLAGCYLGRMACYGRLGHVLRERGIGLCLRPDHVDGAAGLKPVGDFYFRQAMIAAIPVAFLGTWVLLIPFWERSYAHWAKPYLLLLAIALALEVLAFVLPMLSFHAAMRREKTRLLSEADRISQEIERLRVDQIGGAGATQGNTARLDALSVRYWAIENMPTWPVDLSTRNRFNRANLVLVLPLVTRLVDENNKVGSVVKQMLKFLAGVESG